MSAVYSLLGSLPFDFLSSAFMQRAFIAVVLSAALFGLLGTITVDNRMAFFSDALGHSAATGVALGVLLGVRNEVICLIAFGVLVALMINRVRARGGGSTDTIISVFASTALALGLVLLQRSRTAAGYSAYLVGDVISVRETELLMLLITLVAVIIIWIFCYNKFLLISLNRSLAASRGIRVRLWEDVLSVLIAVVVMISIKWVGILLINAMLILPAAAARNVTRGVRSYNITSVVFALIAGISGLAASWYFSTGSGAAIVLCLAVIFFITYIIRAIRNR